MHVQDVNVGVSASDNEDGDEIDDAWGPQAQILMTGTWLSVKELSVVLGTMAEQMPIEGVIQSRSMSCLKVWVFRCWQICFLAGPWESECHGHILH